MNAYCSDGEAENNFDGYQSDDENGSIVESGKGHSINYFFVIFN